MAILALTFLTHLRTAHLVKRKKTGQKNVCWFCTAVMSAQMYISCKGLSNVLLIKLIGSKSSCTKHVHRTLKMAFLISNNYDLLAHAKRPLQVRCLGRAYPLSSCFWSETKVTEFTSKASHSHLKKGHWHMIQIVLWRREKRASPWDENTAKSSMKKRAKRVYESAPPAQWPASHMRILHAIQSWPQKQYPRSPPRKKTVSLSPHHACWISNSCPPHNTKVSSGGCRPHPPFIQKWPCTTCMGTL